MRKNGILLMFSLLICSCVYSQALHNGSSQVDIKNIRPNIVWIVCEDMSLRLSSFGETAIKTPNLDALAKDGVKYTNAYTVAGVCAPSRAGIITAMYPSAIGADNMRNFSENPKNQDKPMESGMLPYSAVPPSYVKCFPDFLREEMYYCANNPKEDYQFESPVTVWDESSAKATWKNRPDGKPFFAIFNLNVTHESQIWKRDNLPLLVDPDKVTVPPYYPDVPEVRHDIARQLSNVIEMDKQVGKLIQQLKDAGLYDDTIIFFYSGHGDGLPYVKREITKIGLWIPLIVKFPYQAKAGTTDDRLVSAIDFGPTVLSLAGVAVPKYMAGKAFLGAIVQYEDITPTLIDMAGGKVIDSLDGKSFLKVIKQEKDKHRDYAFGIHNNIPKGPAYPIRSIRDHDYKLILNLTSDKDYYIKWMMNPNQKGNLWNTWTNKANSSPEALVLTNRIVHRPAIEFYDMQKDPYELNNLTNEVRYQAMINDYKKKLYQWMKNQGDSGAAMDIDYEKEN